MSDASSSTSSNPEAVSSPSSTTPSPQPSKADTATSSGPSWLILGGVGFIGRNLAKELVESKQAGHIRVADKSHWLTAMMHDDHKKHFASKAIEYKQADLSKDCT